MSGEGVHRAAGVISIGDELALGQTLDTNSMWISARLAERGVAVRRHATIADDQGAIAAEIARFAAELDLVVVTGGLGPTADDLTRQALAEAMGAELVTDDAALAEVRSWFESSGRSMPEANAVQATRPASAAMLPNEFGTAPGLRARVGRADVFCFPGPPTELRPMFDRDVLPMLRTGSVVVTRLLRTAGAGESAIAERLGGLMDRDRNPLVGTTASEGVITVRIRYEGADRAEGDRLVDEAAEAVRREVGAYCFGEGDETLAEVLVRELTARHETVTTIESCTGGLIAAALTDVPGSSAVFQRGLVTYSNDVKAELAGVPAWVFAKQGAVSRACVEAMARGGLEMSGGSHAIAVSGIAGPEGGTDEKPVGTVWICRASADGTSDARRLHLKGSREQVRRRSTVMAMVLLWLKLRGAEELRVLAQVEP